MISTFSRGDAEQPLGLTEDGINAILREHRTFDSPSGAGVAQSHRMLEDILECLQANGEMQRRDLVDRFFEGMSTDNPDQLWYTKHKGDEWFADVAAPQLRALPCVAGDDEGEAWRFDPSGIDPEALDDEHVTSLEELRNDPMRPVEEALDERGIGRRTDERAALRSLWKTIRNRGSVPADELDTVGNTGLSADDVERQLKSLPGIERTVETPPEPEEIPVETMADVLEGHERLEAGAVGVWRFDDDAV